MGYTNDWYVLGDLEPIPKDVLEKLERVLNIFSDPKTLWKCIKDVKCSEEFIAFKHDSSEDYFGQDFLFQTKNPSTYNFCKTYKCDYDLPMKIVLIILKNHYRDKLSITSYKIWDWLPAILFCKLHCEIEWTGFNKDPLKRNYDSGDEENGGEGKEEIEPKISQFESIKEILKIPKKKSKEDV